MAESVTSQTPAWVREHAGRVEQARRSMFEVLWNLKDTTEFVDSETQVDTLLTSEEAITREDVFSKVERRISTAMGFLHQNVVEQFREPSDSLEILKALYGVITPEPSPADSQPADSQPADSQPAEYLEVPPHEEKDQRPRVDDEFVLDQYWESVKRFSAVKEQDTRTQIMYYALGLVGEFQEFMQTACDSEEERDEAGDVLWYMVALRNSFRSFLTVANFVKPIVLVSADPCEYPCILAQTVNKIVRKTIRGEKHIDELKKFDRACKTIFLAITEKYSLTELTELNKAKLIRRFGVQSSVED